MPDSKAPHGEQGMALVVALLAMLVMSLIAVALMTTLNSETRIASHNLMGSQALNLAEAGISEASARIRAGDVPNNGNPRMVAQIFQTAQGSVPVLGTDSVSMATAQPAGQWLDYSMPTRGEQVLTVTYKTDPARTLIYKYDSTKNPPIQTVSGMPIYVVTSTGRKGQDKVKVISEVAMKPINVQIKAAIASNLDIKVTGNNDACGYNHSASTPVNTAGTRGPCLAYELGSGTLPGIWSTGSVNPGGASTQHGTPPVLDGQTGFYEGPWSVLSMTQADFFAWVGSPITAMPNPPRGIIHLDNNATAQDRSGSYSFNGGAGEGLLYVDGDLTLNGGSSFQGLIYVEGDLKFNGNSWVLGAMIVRGKTTIKINGGSTILYSNDAVMQNISKYGGQLLTLSWRDTRQN